MFGTDARIVEARRDAVRLGDLAVFILKQIGFVAMEDAGASAREAGGMFAFEAFARGFDTDDLYALVIEEGMEEADRVRSAADGGDEHVGEAALGLEDLFARFGADHRLEVADELGIGVRPRDGADDVEGVVDVRDPVAQRLVHRVLERLGARFDRDDFGAEQFHAEHIGLLSRDIDRAHEDGAGQAEERGDGRGGDAMLTRAGFGDDFLLAHPLGEQDLADAIVDLVRAGVVEILALQIDFRAAEILGQPLGEP